MKAHQTAYARKLQDPRWQKRRLEILARDGWACVNCKDKLATLHVHHRYYANGDPWDVPDDALETLCVYCHAEETERRRPAEAMLLRALATRFRSWDLEAIAEGMNNMTLPHLPEVVADALRVMLSDPGRIKQVVEWYLASIPQEAADSYQAEWMCSGEEKEV